MTYRDEEPTFTTRRVNGMWRVIVRYGSFNGRPETYEAEPCSTSWGARRRGRREVARIKREKTENGPLDALMGRVAVLRTRALANQDDETVWAEYNLGIVALGAELTRRRVEREKAA